VADPEQGEVLVIGVGNELRRDDGAGIEVARRVQSRRGGERIVVCELQGETTALLDAWRGYDAVVIVDTSRSGAAPGTIRRMDAGREPLPVGLRSSSSTHAVGIGEAIELGRALGQLPARLVVYGVEGACFEAGIGLSEELQRIVPRLSETVFEEACALRACQRSSG
jgi:hydrogenase maturation protease